MKVVLTKDVEGWGTIGDVIEVKKVLQEIILFQED
jgi:Ribosomal protein L9, N-terminal domain.